MDNQSAKNQVIEQRFETAWGGLKATDGGKCDVFFKNSPMPPTMPDEYINVLAFDGGGENHVIPNNKTRRFCSVVGEVRTPKGQGTARAEELAHDFQEIYENQTISGMHFRVASVSEVDGQSHYGINVFIPYEWERGNA
jgi:hypothetical protein